MIIYIIFILQKYIGINISSYWINLPGQHTHIYLHKQPYSVGPDNDKQGIIKQLDMQSTASLFPANTDYCDTCHQPIQLQSFQRGVWIHTLTAVVAWNAD